MANELNSHPHSDDKPAPGQPWSDKLAHWYIDNFGDHPTYTLALRAAGLQGGETLLDIGCGNGTAVRAAAQALPHGRSIGIDPTPAMIRAAVGQSQSHPARQRVQFLEAPAEALPVDAASVDVVIAVCSLHHWGDIPKCLSEIERVLKPAGRLIVAEDLFDEPDMSLDIKDIQALIDASALRVTGVNEQSHSQGNVHILTARRKNIQ